MTISLKRGMVKIYLTPAEANILRAELVSQETNRTVKKALWEGLMELKGKLG